MPEPPVSPPEGSKVAGVPGPLRRWLNTRRALVQNVGVAVVFGIVIAALAWYFGQPSSGSDATSQSVTLTAKVTGPAPRVGMPAPDFRVIGLDGTPHQLSDFRGHPVWLNFWATWCPPCRAEAPDIESAYEQYAGAGLIVLAVDVGEGQATVQGYVQRVGLKYLIGGDQSTEISAQYHVSGLPTHYFIDANGVIRDMQLGSIGKQNIEKKLASILTPAGAATK